MQIKENIKAPRHWPLCWEFTGDRWIPRTKGQLRGKCFHLMTSSWMLLLYAQLMPVHAVQLLVFRGTTPLRWRHNGRDGVSNHWPHHCLLNRLFRRWSKKTSKLYVTGLCAENSPVTGEFPAQMASNAENFSIWWRHHAECSDISMRIITTTMCIMELKSCLEIAPENIYLLHWILKASLSPPNYLDTSLLCFKITSLQFKFRQSFI